MELYASKHFAMIEVRVTGKKQVSGTLCFEGLPSIWGDKDKILALEDGIVLRAGRCNDIGSRDHRLGTCVTISGRGGVSITYGRLACRYVQKGDYVRAGQLIGLEGDSGAGTGQYLTLDFRRNGRRVDGCAYLGIPHYTQEFLPPDRSDADTVCELCGLSDLERHQLNSLSSSDLIWTRLANRLSDRHCF